MAHPPRGDSPRRSRAFAAMAGMLALALFAGGLFLTRAGGVLHLLGIMCVGYGLGIGVASVFLLAGWRPGGRGRP